MFYEFPKITHINDVLPAIKDKSEFIVAKRDHFDVVNYVVMTPDTFPPVTSVNDAILRECRGIMFDLHGKLLSRPFHKFFNLNERPETQLNTLSLDDAYSMVKLDGSMIRPVWIEQLKEFWWCTKMGMSDTAINANYYAKNPCRKGYEKFAQYAYVNGFTPCFEWCSNKNRIVISYPEDKLVLIGARHNLTGEYFEYDDLVYLGKKFNIPVVETYESQTPEELVNTIKTMVGIEGFIINLCDNHKVKIKCDEYLLIHKVKEVVTNERKLMELFLENKLDDIKGSLSEDDLKIVLEFEADTSNRIAKKVAWLDEEFSSVLNKYHDRRDFAINSELGSNDRSMIFSKYGDKSSLEIVLSQIAKHLSSLEKYERLKQEILVV